MAPSKQKAHSLQRLRALRAFLGEWGTHYAHTNHTFTPEELVSALTELITQCEALWERGTEERPHAIPSRQRLVRRRNP